MAIRRVDPNLKFRLISELDDALVPESAEELQAIKASGGTTRYEAYLENLDESKLQFREGAKPSHFVIRCLRNAEVAEFQQKHLTVDTAAKKVEMGNMALAFLDYFRQGCLGMENDAGVVEPITADEVGYAVALSVGSVIFLYTTMGKHLKK